MDARQPAEVPSIAAEGAGPGVALAAPPCQGDGVSGARVQLVYARAAGVADRYSTLLPNFQLWAAQVDDVFNLSAIETGGTRHIRVVHDAACTPLVAKVTLSAPGDDTFANTISELRAQGHSRSDRKYLLWVDANVYCGIAEVYNDDRAGEDNPNNGRAGIPGMVARIDSGCWGRSNGLVEAHELVHNLGGVPPTAPNATANDHCTDDFDRMCYVDAAGVTVRVVCPSTGHENRLDCNHDDYYSTAPTPGSWLATHWNTASSSFLAGGGTSPPTTTTTTTSPATTTTTTTSPTTTTTTTRPPATTTTTTTVPPAASTQNARFVERAYRDLLGRSPSTSDLAYWLDALAGGLSRDSVAGIITTSNEFRRLIVGSYYMTFLGRSPTNAERDALVNAVGGGWPFEAAATVVLGGPEFYARQGSTHAGYVRALFRMLLGIDPNAAAVGFWVDQLTTKGLDRNTVAWAFLTSGLEHSALVNFAYGYFLDRPADPAGLVFWHDQLAVKGMRQEIMFAYFVGSGEYYSKV